MPYSIFIKDLLFKINELKKYLDYNNIKNIKLLIFKIDTTNIWVSQHLYHNLKDINITIINKKKYIKENDFVVYVDDYIRSYDDYKIKQLFSIKYKLPSYKLYIIASYVMSK